MATKTLYKKLRASNKLSSDLGLAFLTSLSSNTGPMIVVLARCLRHRANTADIGPIRIYYKITF